MARGPKRGPFRGPRPARGRLIAAAAGTSALFLDWYVPLQEPPKEKIVNPALYSQYHTGTTPRILVSQWFQPLSEPQVPKRTLHASRQQAFTMDTDWLAPPTPVNYVPSQWADPQKQPSGLSAAWGPFISSLIHAPFVDLRYAWLEPLSEPVRFNRFATALQQPFTTDWQWNAPAVVVTYAPLPLSEPVRTKPRAAYLEPFTTDWKWSAPSYESNWYQPFSEPVRSKQRPTYSEPFRTDWQWSAPNIFGWHQPLGEPVRKSKPAVAYQQPFTTDWNAPAVVVNYVPQGLAEPVRTKQFAPALQQFFTTDWDIPDVFVSHWVQPLSTPVRDRLRAPYFEPFTIDGRWTPVVVNYVQQPFAEPLRSRAQLTVITWQQATAIPTAGVTTVPPPLSEPVWRKRATWQQPFTMDWEWTAPFDPAQFISWFRGLSEPVRYKQRVVWQQPFTTDWQWTAPTVVITFWSQPLSEPVREKTRAPYFEPFTFDWKWSQPNIYGWYREFSQPVRTKPRAAYYEPFTTDWKWAPPIIFGWHVEFSEPVRTRQFHAARQQFFVNDTQWRAPVSIGWYEWLSHPRWSKKAVAFQMPFTTDWKWDAPVFANITYSFSILETGDSGALVYQFPTELDGAHVSLTEEKVGNMAVVTITEVDD